MHAHSGDRCQDTSTALTPLLPPSSLLLCCCSWLAVVVRQRVMLLSLATHKLVHTLPPLADPQPALTAVAFTADSAAVVVAASTHQVAAYDVQTGQPTQWTQQHSSSSSSGGLPAKLLRMPGSILSIASCPAAPLSLFLQSAEACCHLDMTQPLEPAGEDQQQQQHDRKRRRSQHRAAAASEPPGGNCRMLYCADPVLHASYLTSDALLVVSAGKGMMPCPPLQHDFQH